MELRRPWKPRVAIGPLVLGGGARVKPLRGCACLAAYSRVGPYEAVALLRSGGMAETHWLRVVNRTPLLWPLAPKAPVHPGCWVWEGRDPTLRSPTEGAGTSRPVTGPSG